MGRRPKYTPEFRHDAVALIEQGDRSMNQVARDLGVSRETLRAWVKQHRIDQGQGAPGELTTTERQELSRLRRRVAELEKDQEILRKAAAYFAAEMPR